MTRQDPRARCPNCGDPLTRIRCLDVGGVVFLDRQFCTTCRFKRDTPDTVKGVSLPPTVPAMGGVDY